MASTTDYWCTLNLDAPQDCCRTPPPSSDVHISIHAYFGDHSPSSGHTKSFEAPPYTLPLCQFLDQTPDSAVRAVFAAIGEPSPLPELVDMFKSLLSQIFNTDSIPMLFNARSLHLYFRCVPLTRPSRITRARNVARRSPAAPVSMEIELEGSCAICIDDFSCTTQDKILWLPCSHVYHKDCIRKWLRKSRTCPICRRTVSLRV